MIFTSFIGASLQPWNGAVNILSPNWSVLSEIERLNGMGK
jgi:hypothetical protein